MRFSGLPIKSACPAYFVVLSKRIQYFWSLFDSSIRTIHALYLKSKE